MAEGIRIPVPAGADLMQPYPVKLPMFEGPLDLLLHLIRKNEVDLKNLPVADICRQYHEYIVLMVELDLEVAAEFLYVEAMLLHIKSQMVLPRAPTGEGEVEDPRDELVRRLLEYRKYKGVAESLHEMEAVRLGLWSRPPTRVEMTEGEAEETDLSEVSLFDLLTFFKGAVDRYRAQHPPSMEIAHQKYSIKEKMEEMLARVKSGDGPVLLSDVFRGLSGRGEAIAIFLAVLELLRLRVVRARQDGEFNEIFLDPTGESVSLEGYEEAYR
jgi:segregation and condensation protein A